MPSRYYGRQCEKRICDDNCINGKCELSGVTSNCECNRFSWGDRCQNHCSKYCENGQCETRNLEFVDRKYVPVIIEYGLITYLLL